MKAAHCARCGYDLVGLPVAGGCPECGRPYDKATRTNVSEDGAVDVSGGTARKRFAAGFLALAVLIAAVGCVWAGMSDDPLRPLAFGLTGAAVCVVIGLFPLTR